MRELYVDVIGYANKLNIRQPKNENGMTKYQAPYIWNKLPESITKSPSHTTFKKKRKHYLELQNI